MNNFSNYVHKVETKYGVFYYNLFTGFISDDERLICKNTHFGKNNSANILDEHQKLLLANEYLLLNVVLTKRCNFACTYCFETQSQMDLQADGIEHIREIVAYYKRKTPSFKKLVVFWFGGEPLLKIDLISKLSKMFTELEKELSISFTSRIITNGYLLDKIFGVIEDIKLTDIQITLDGNRDAHNSRRPLKDGASSYETIISNIESITSPVNLNIRLNIDENNFDGLLDFYNDISSIKLNNNVTLSINCTKVECYDSKSANYVNNSNSSEFYDRYNDFLAQTKQFAKPCFIGSYCGFEFGNSLTIDADGKIYKCWASIGDTDKSIGSIFTDKTDEIYDRISTRYLFPQNCIQCDVFPACMGGCIFLRSDKYCENMRKDILFFMKKYIEEQYELQVIGLL